MEIGWIRKVILCEQGISMVDVLAAIAIIGIIALSVWQAQSNYYLALNKANKHSLLTMYAVSTGLELESSLKRNNYGEYINGSIKWDFYGGDRVEVYWNGTEEVVSFPISSVYIK